MQSLIDGLRELAANTVYFFQVLDTGARDALQPAELPQQFAALARPQSWHGFQHGFSARFGATMAMTGNGKSMCLVANSLYQMQGR